VLPYLPVIDHGSPAEAAGLPAGMVAVQAADLQIRPVELPGGRGAVLAGAAVAPGTMMTFCHPVVTAPAVIRGGMVLAGGPLIPGGVPSAVMLAGMPVCEIDGSLVTVADTKQNRKAFGCSGTKHQHGAEAAPFPQLQAVLVTARAGRATLGAICGRARAGEQTLLARLIRRRPGLFAGRAFAFDRNFPGHAIITAILGAGAGDRTSGPVLRSGFPRLVIQEFWAWLTATQLVRASAAAALDSGVAADRALRRREDAGPVTAGQVSFTAARHQAIRSMTWSQVTAGASLAALAAVADAAARSALHTLITTGRHRHSERAQKARPKFPHTAATKKTVFAPSPP